MPKDRRTIENEALRIQLVSYLPGFHMPPHTDMWSKISIVIDGSVGERTTETDAAGKTGSIFIKPSYALHENHFSDKPAKLLTMSLKNDAVFSRYFDCWQFLNHPKVYVKAIELWTKLRRLKNDGELNAALRTFSNELPPLSRENENAFYWCGQFKHLLTENLTEPERIGLISQKIALHRVYLGRTFKRLNGTSPSEYRHFAKTAAALVELVLTDKSISSIAADSGFSDQSHLTRTLKRQLGVTPAKFRRAACYL
jgi:AraC-like DNA-binding protein